MGDGLPAGRGPSAAAGRHFSQLLGTRVHRDGAELGRVSDLAVLPAGAVWHVVALRLRDGREIAFAADAAIGGEGGVALHSTEPAPPGPLVWLRSILDRQVIDVDGRRVVRVGDIELAQSRGRLDAVGIELGAAPLLRRLGLRRMAERCTPALVPLTAIHVPGAHGVALELTTSRDRLAALESHDVAELLARLPLPAAGHELGALPAENAARAVGALPPAHAADMLAHAPEHARARILEHMRPRTLAPVLRGIGRAPRRITRHRATRRPRHL